MVLAVQNIANKGPMIGAPGPEGNNYLTNLANLSLCDTLAQQFHLGARFKL